MTPIDWDVPLDQWGGHVHVADWAPDGTHDDVTGDEQ